MKRAFCVIGDLIGSRQIQGRSRFQTRLKEGLTSLSRDRPGIVSPYTITLGDEFQAVYSRPEGIFRDLLEIQALVHPTGVRFAVAVGSLSTVLNRESSIGMDGPAFALARDTLTGLKRSDYLYRIAGVLPSTSAWANGALDLTSHIVSRWNKNRLKIAVQLFDGAVPQEIELTPRISKSAVYKSIAAGAVPEVISMLRLIGTGMADRRGCPE